jgi:diaminopimelate decarboxylase
MSSFADQTSGGDGSKAASDLAGLPLGRPHHVVPLTLPQLERAAARFGTPFQLYDEGAIRANARALIAAFTAHFPGFRQHFAVKALPNPAILRALMDEGCGLDCSSTSELHIAAKLGCAGDHVCFTSNFTSREDLRIAAEQGVTINLDDVSLVPELARATADGAGFPSLISFRLNPGVGRTDSKTLSNVLGGPNAKFGVAHFQIVEAYRQAIACGATRFGIHMMTGSCVMSDAYWEESLGRMLDQVAALRAELSIEFEYINVGGGLGIPYRPEQGVVDVPGLVVRMRKVFDAKIAEHGMPEPVLHMENGRYMTGPFGWLVARCHAVKRSYATYYGLDACMSNLMRPGMYGSYHHITVPARDPSACDAAASPPEGAQTALANVVGTLCENNDWFAKDRALPTDAQVGDLFVIHETGAHAHSMGFQYNGKLRAPELLLRGDGRGAGAVEGGEPKVVLIRKRETIESLFENCVMPEN